MGIETSFTQHLWIDMMPGHPITGWKENTASRHEAREIHIRSESDAFYSNAFYS